MSMSVLGVLLDSCSVPHYIFKAAIQEDTLLVPMENLKGVQSLILRNRELPYDILVVKYEGNYTALQMLCTHNDVALSFTGNKLICNGHGSEFDLQGKVLRDPAARQLTSYRTSVERDNLVIHLKG